MSFSELNRAIEAIGKREGSREKYCDQSDRASFSRDSTKKIWSSGRI